MYRKTVSKEAESRCSTELGRQLEIVVGSNAHRIAQYCAEKLQLAEMLRSDLANLKQQLTKHYQSTCSAAGGVQTTESMLR